MKMLLSIVGFVSVTVSASLAARGAGPAAFDARGIPGDGVATRSNTLSILARRALSAGRRTRLDATRDLHHGLLLARTTPAAPTPEERGLEIALETEARDAGFGNWVATATMILRDKQGGEAVRTFRMMAYERTDDGDRTLAIFDKPADLAGAAVLTYSHALVPDDQWLYLPAVKRVKRISSGNKASLFMGSEFAYEDLSSWEVKKYKYRYLRDEKVDEHDCFVVENVPAYADSAYSKQIEWVDKTIFHPRRLDYYDRQGRLLKTMTFSKYQQYLGKHWRASEQLMQNQQTGKATQVVWGPYQFKAAIHESEFTPEGLVRSK